MSRDNHSESKLKIRRIDGHYRFALDFFWKHGAKFFESIKYSENDSEIKVFRVGFVGFGEYAYEFLKVLCCLGQLPRCRLIIYIFDKNAQDRKEKFGEELLYNRANRDKVIASGLNTPSGSERNLKESGYNEMTGLLYHDYPFYEIHFVKCNVEKDEFFDNCFIKKEVSSITQHKEEKVEHFTHMFFMLGSDKTNIDVATRVSIAYQRNPQTDGNNVKPQFYVMVKNDNTTAQLNREGGLFKESYRNITLIGSNCERYSYEEVDEEEVEKAGLKVHRLYAFNKELPKFFEKAEEKINDNGSGELEKEAYKILKEIIKKDFENHSIASIMDKEYGGALLWFLYSETEKIVLQKLKESGLDIKPSADQWLRFYGQISTAAEDLTSLYDDNVLEEKYNKKEYYRRSSNSRALFEKMLFELGYLYYEGNRVKPNNVVSEFGVTADNWELPVNKKGGKIDQSYNPKNIFFYKTNENKLQSANNDKRQKADKISEIIGCYQLMKKWESDPSRVNMKGSELIKLVPHINVQWFEVNNILQKRWMVFRWGEGYELSNDNSIQEIDFASKSHKYLRPYIEIYADDAMRMAHTLDISYRPTKRQ